MPLARHVSPFTSTFGRMRYAISTVVIPVQPYAAGLIRPALTALRANAIPGVILWMMAVGIFLAHQYVPQAQPWFAALSSWKQSAGMLGAVVATALCAGLVPFLLLWATGRVRPGQARIDATFFLTLFAIKGVELDLWFRFQTWMFGSATDIGTVLAKVCFDQFVYTPLWATSSLLVLFAWRDGGYSRGAFTHAIRPANFFALLLPTLLANWAVWFPTHLITYSLPVSLQLPIVLCIVTFWILMMNTMSANTKNDTVSPNRS
jgi:hypothetical protein